ncbi:proteasome [Pseudomonas phage vB_PsaM_M1]|nr:proteasome [Pseudomonas phage vB_PsaM_M1]
MTTIVIDFKRTQIASDSQTTSHMCDEYGGIVGHTQHYSHSTEKVTKVKGIYIAGAGDSDAIQREKRNYAANGSLTKKPSGEWTIAIVQAKGDFLHVDIHKSNVKKTWYGKKYYQVSTESYLRNHGSICFGSGGSYAYAGMMTGMCAKDAVLLAAKCDIYTDTNVQVSNILEAEE